MRKVLVTLFFALFGAVFAQGTITVWTHFGGPELAWLQSAAQSFQKASGTTVNIVTVPFGDIKQKFILGAPQGKGPDLVVTLPQDQMGEMAVAGVLEPLDKYVTQNYVSGLEPVAVDAFTYGGKLFGMPMSAESVALIYNKKLVPNPPKTWDEFLAIAKKFTTSDTFGFLYNETDAYFNYGFFRMEGAYVFGKNPDGSANTSDIGLGGAVGAKALDFIKALRYTYGLVPDGVDYGVADGAFKDGALAMILNGPWSLGDYKKANLDFGVIPFPTPPGTKRPWGPFVGVQGVVVNAYSQNKIAAVNFAKFLVTPESQVSFNQAGGRIPVSKSALAKLQSDQVVKGFSEAIALGTPMPNVPAMGKVWGPMADALKLAEAKQDSNTTQIASDLVRQIQKGIAGAK